MRFNLKVPFAEKDKAKKLGARWDAALKLWYVAGETDVTPFAPWSPTPHEGKAVANVGMPARGAVRQQASGKIFVGSAFVETARLCDCLPWDVCVRCQPMSINKPD
ncbi:MAG: hypothetical protein D3M94_03760 [Rhodocyclales bacterium GT-UBC]|nr:MAG: hypothetical protein D3M94_03760 [Rhodocyclales bacterium GT-UBC]